jgi:AbrB family looped-hinge helix DNA binding protein
MAETVTVTSKGQITIPANLRRELEIAKGSKLIVTREGRILKMVPVPQLSKLAGVDKEVFKGRKPSKEVEEIRKEWTLEFEKRSREI